MTQMFDCNPTCVAFHLLCATAHRDCTYTFVSQYSDCFIDSQIEFDRALDLMLIAANSYLKYSDCSFLCPTSSFFHLIVNVFPSLVI